MKDDLAYIEHIKEAISKIIRYTQNLTREAFEDNPMVQEGQAYS